MLHGGPWSREGWPASSLVRFLGSRSYAVLNLNYRGSSGYNRDIMDAGRGTLFGRLQQDILDAAQWAGRRVMLRRTGSSFTEEASEACSP